MNFEDRIKAVVEFGLTERQARFLVTVMLHAGVCVPRQYARFAGIAYGHKVNRFFGKLVRRGYGVVHGDRRRLDAGNGPHRFARAPGLLSTSLALGSHEAFTPGGG